MSRRLPRIIRYEVKNRARTAALKNFGWLLLVFGGLRLIQYLLGTVAGMASNAIFGASGDMTLFGVTFSLPGELLSLISLFITAPIELGVASYVLSALRGNRAKLSTIFDWAGDPKKLKLAMLFASWNCVFAAVTFPLGRLSLYYVADVFGSYVDTVTTQIIATGAVPVIEVDQQALLLAFGAFLLYLVLSIPMLGLQFVIADNPRLSFGRSFKYAFLAMRQYWWQYIVFVLSFLPWMIFSCFFFFILFWFAIYFEVAAAAFVDQARRNYNRGDFLAGVNGGPDETDSN